MIALIRTELLKLLWTRATWGFLAAAVVAVLVLLGILSRFFVDLLWFGSLGLRSVFTTVWLTEISIFVIAAPAR